ncbi:hypothetical protein D3C80_525570 [compost metagenome]
MEGFVQADLRIQLVDKVLLFANAERQPQVLGHAQGFAAVRQALQVFAQHTAFGEVGALAQGRRVAAHVGTGAGDFLEEILGRSAGLARGIDDQLQRLLQVVELQLGEHHADLQGRQRRVGQVAVGGPGADQLRGLAGALAAEKVHVHGIANGG